MSGLVRMYRIYLIIALAVWRLDHSAIATCLYCYFDQWDTIHSYYVAKILIFQGVIALYTKILHCDKYVSTYLEVSCR